MKRIAFLLLWTACGFMFFEAQGQPSGFNPSSAPKNGVISGKVLDEKTGEFVEYAVVSVFKQKDSSLVTLKIFPMACIILKPALLDMISSV
jgi:hypothetical protein